MATKIKAGKYVYFFGGGKADGNESMKNLLGGKGANLAEMAGHPKLQLPVPPGFTVTTEVCTYYYNNKKTYPKTLKLQTEEALGKMEKLTGKKFGDEKNPLLVSVRSGARRSMPGMMETVLNVGLNEQTIKGIIAQSGDERFAYDAYRRLIMMYADVVMEKGNAVELKNGKGIRKILDEKLEYIKHKQGYTSDTELSVDELKELVKDYKKTVKKILGTEFPDDPWQQLWGGISAVFSSWNGKRAIEYRRIEKIPDEWGTAVNVQAMVFGNLGDDSCTGVAFTRNPGNGENKFYGEYLVKAQGEDVVAEQQMRALGDVTRIFHHVGEELAEQRRVDGVHLVVAPADLDGGRRIARRIGIERSLELTRHQVGHVLHAVVEFRRQTEAFDLHGALAQLLGHVAGALEITRHLHRRDDHTQICRHGLPAGDHRNRQVIDAMLHLVDLLVRRADLHGEFMVQLEQRGRRVGDGEFDHAAHFGDQPREQRQFILVG